MDATIALIPNAFDDPDLLPPPDEVAAEIVESLETALQRFRSVAKALSESQAENGVQEAPNT